MTFEETKLLDHPSVRAAYDAMTNRFSGGEGFHAYAIQAAEIISTTVSNPDPDAVIAAIHMPEDLKAGISPKSAEYTQEWYAAVDGKNKTPPVSEAGKQVVLAHAIVELRDVQEQIRDREYWGSNTAYAWIEKHSAPLLAAADAQAQPLVDLALAELHTAEKLTQDWIAEAQAGAVYEKQGLPDHSALRAAYELMRQGETSHDPVYTSHSHFGASAARILFESGVTDPDVLGAAILNQYSQQVPAEMTKDLMEGRDFEGAHARIEKWKAEHADPIIGMFSERLVDLYRKTSPFYHGEKEEKNTADTVLIRRALTVSTLESMLDNYAERRKKPEADAYRLLEMIDEYSAPLKATLEKTTPPALKARVEKDIAAAETILNKPKNLTIRKPGSPHRDYDGGW